jgi:hypothetical protein
MAFLLLDVKLKIFWHSLSGMLKDNEFFFNEKAQIHLINEHGMSFICYFGVYKYQVRKISKISQICQVLPKGIMSVTIFNNKI